MEGHQQVQVTLSLHNKGECKLLSFHTVLKIERMFPNPISSNYTTCIVQVQLTGSEAVLLCLVSSSSSVSCLRSEFLMGRGCSCMNLKDETIIYLLLLQDIQCLPYQLVLKGFLCTSLSLEITESANPVIADALGNVLLHLDHSRKRNGDG